MLPAPEVRFARSDGQSLAYATYGTGPLDIVFVSPLLSHVEVMVEPRPLSQIYGRLSRLGRLILFDRRGAGLSDPAPGYDVGSIDAWSEDLEAVLGTVGTGPVCLFTFDTGAPYATIFAATHPERVRSIALVEPVIPTASDGLVGLFEAIATAAEQSWGAGAIAPFVSPALAADPTSAAWWARFERMSMSRSTAARQLRDFAHLDTRSALPFVQAPVLVIRNKGLDEVMLSAGIPNSAALLQDLLPKVEVVEVSHTDVHWWWQGDLRAELLDAVDSHFTGRPVLPDVDRVLATVLFTDVVDSTQTAASVGDRRWREALDEHDALIAEQLELHRGILVHGTGDGVLATFDAPARAVQCAKAIRSGLHALQLDSRIGIHTGEIQRRGTDIAGIAVHIAARIMALAHDGEILVSRTVRDLVVGSGLTFSDRGDHALKGVPDTWQLLAVEE